MANLTRADYERAAGMYTGQAPAPAPAGSVPLADGSVFDPDTGQFIEPNDWKAQAQPAPVPVVEPDPPMSVPAQQARAYTDKALASFDARDTSGGVNPMVDDALASFDRGQEIAAPPIAAPPAAMVQAPAIKAPAAPAVTAPSTRVANPLSGIQSEAAAEGAQAQSQADAYGTQASIDNASQQQAVEDTAQAKSDAYGNIAKIGREFTQKQNEDQFLLRHMQEAEDRAAAKTMQEAQDISKWLNENVEPRDRRSTGQKVMGALAIAFGALGQGLQQMGGIQNAKNMGLEAVNASIERDLAAQDKAISNKKAAFAAKQTELGMAQSIARDKKEAWDLARAARLQQYKTALDAELNTGLSKEALAEGQRLSAAIGQEYNMTMERVQQQRADSNRETERRVAIQRWQEQKAADAARARAAAAGPNWGKFTVQELELAAQRGQLPADGVKYLEELRGKGLANEKTATEIEQGRNPQLKMSDGDKKLARLAAGVQPAVNELLPYLDDKKDMPWLGARGVGRRVGAVVPDAFIPDENLKFDSNVNALTNVLLRDESGANLPPEEQAGKKASWGIQSGSERVSREGLKKMLYEFAARKANGTLPPDAQPIDEQPVARGR